MLLYADCSSTWAKLVISIYAAFSLYLYNSKNLAFKKNKYKNS